MFYFFQKTALQEKVKTNQTKSKHPTRFMPNPAYARLKC